MNVRTIFLHAALILTSVLFVLIFSYSTSPLYNLLGGDSAIFQVVGKYWAQGYLPYVNVFDHKGPLIFFVNMLGYMIQPRTGVTVLQIFSLYMSLIFVWRAMSLYSTSTATKIFFMAFTLIYYAAHCEEGNHVTEYTLPFLSASAYCFLTTLKNSATEKFQCPPSIGFVYGVGFGACVLIRTSDAAQICCEIFLTAIFLLQTREFKTLRQNIFGGVAGFAAIVAPFAVYFAAHGIFYDALYGTILLNLKYAADPTLYPSFEYRVIYVLIHLMPFFIVTIVAALALRQNPTNRLLWSGLFIAAAVAFMLIKLRSSDQYEMIFLAIAPIFFAVLCESHTALSKAWQHSFISIQRMFVKILGLVMAVHVFIMMFYLETILTHEKRPIFIFFTAYFNRIEFLNTNEHENVLKLRALIPDDEKDSFACWGAWNTGAHWILQTDMKPRERFFMNNGLLVKMDPKIREEFFGNLRRDYPLWIIYGTAPNRKPGEPPITFSEDAELEQLLAEKYSLKGEVYIYPQIMKLYRLKD